MSPDLQRIPVAVELFAQWRRARGTRQEEASRPFSRSWPELLRDAGIVSALEEREAEQDARVLAAAGLLALKPVRYKPHLIERIAIPLEAEPIWREAFGFTGPSDEESRRIRAHPWHPRLAFVCDAALYLSFDELARLDAFLKNAPGDLVPIKERSLEIFGHEKRLDVLYGSSALFGTGRLSLEDLCCFVVPEPLAWKRGSRADGPVLVLENLATWHSYTRWDAQHKLFSAIVYGAGKRFIDSVLSIPDLFAELGGQREMFYFGDLDPAGLRIPRIASNRAVAAGLPEIRPHLWSYRALLSFSATHTPAPNQAPSSQGQAQQPTENSNILDPADLLWLGELAPAAEKIIVAGQRIPQERVGWDYLCRAKPPD